MGQDSRKILMDVIKKWMPYPEEPAEESCWAPEVEKADPDRIKEMQSEKLEATFRYICEYSPYYKEKYERAGLTPKDIKSIEDLHKIPVTDKKDLWESLRRSPPWGDFSCVDEELWKKDGWIVWLTTGTTGAPIPCRYTQFDRVIQSWHLARQYLMSGIRSSDLVMYCMPFTTHIFSWHHYTAQELAKIPMLPGGPPLPTGVRIDLIMKYKPTVLIGTPTYMIYLGETMKEKGIDPKEVSVRVVVVAGEPGGSLLPTRRRLASLWDVDVSDLFGSTECGASGHATMCEYETKDRGRNSYLHYVEDAGIPEVLSPDTMEPLPEGEYGTLVWSCINSISQPILRFDLKDMVNIRTIKCPCGRTSRMSEGGIIGRTDDMIHLRGVNVFPTNIEESVRSINEFGNEYRLKVVEDDKGLPDLIVEVEVRIEVSEQEHERLKNELQACVRDKCQIRATIDIVPYGSLPRAEFKAKRVLDLRKGKQS